MRMRKHYKTNRMPPSFLYMEKCTLNGQTPTGVFADFYYANDATNVAWNHIGTVEVDPTLGTCTCTTGVHTEVKMEYTIPHSKYSPRQKKL